MALIGMINPTIMTKLLFSYVVDKKKKVVANGETSLHEIAVSAVIAIIIDEIAKLYDSYYRVTIMTAATVVAVISLIIIVVVLSFLL